MVYGTLLFQLGIKPACHTVEAESLLNHQGSPNPLFMNEASRAQRNKALCPMSLNVKVT